MGIHTKIQWCDSTINGTSGCGGCELWDAVTRICYAGNLQEKRLATSLPAKYDPVFTNVRAIPGRFAKAAGWRDLYGKLREDKPWLNGFQRIIFVGDLSDIMSSKVPRDFLQDELMGAINSTAGQRHMWILCTKRPHRLREFVEDIGGLPNNVCVMASITNQKTADWRVKALLQIPAAFRALSIEPLLGPVSLEITDGYWNGIGIDWVIIGGASGINAPPCNIHWIAGLIGDCRESNTPVFVKQLGSNPVWTDNGAAVEPMLRYDYEHPKSGDWMEWPESLRIRSMPNFTRVRQQGGFIRKPSGSPQNES